MPRVNVWLPDELHAALKGELPHVNVSQLLQAALREALGCPHDELACRRCAAPIDRDELVTAALGDFYADALWSLEALVRRCGTAEGAARILKEVALRWRVERAERLALPRPSRANRHAAADPDVRTLPTETESRARHATAKPQPMLNDEENIA